MALPNESSGANEILRRILADPDQLTQFTQHYSGILDRLPTQKPGVPRETSEFSGFKIVVTDWATPSADSSHVFTWHTSTRTTHAHEAPRITEQKFQEVVEYLRQLEREPDIRLGQPMMMRIQSIIDDPTGIYGPEPTYQQNDDYISKGMTIEEFQAWSDQIIKESQSGEPDDDI